MSRPDILVVEDDGATRDLLRMSLELEGYTVSLAANGAEGWQRLREAPPSLLVLDIMMPEMNGVELLGRIRGDPVLSSLPVIVVSALGALTSAAATLVDEYVPKPFDLDALIATVARYCAAPVGSARP